jgi:cell division protein FtsB
MSERRRIKQTTSLSDRLKTFSDELKTKASQLRSGAEQAALLKRARRADTASHIDEWANSPGLQAPK